MRIFTLPAAAATPTEINIALDRGTACLLAAQQNGNWETVQAPDARPGMGQFITGGQWGGQTAISTYALLCSGVSSSDPHLVQAIHFLTVNEPRGTYCAAARCLVWSRVPLGKETRAAARRDFKFLVSCMRRTGEGKGAFDYGPEPQNPGNPVYDHSASQFAVLGLWSLVQEGFELDTSDWNMMDAAWRAHQYQDGSWSYYDKPDQEWNNHTVSMTAAGVATLFIFDQNQSRRANCTGNPVDKNIAKGIDWLSTHFDSVYGSIRAGYHVEPYALFSLSRLGASSGYKYLGKIDWFAASSDWLIHNQQPNGSWSTNYLDPVPGTAFGLLCLSYGRAPVVLNKLQYSRPGPKSVIEARWNQRPQDCLNFVNWLSKSLETRLNWQIVTLASPAKDLQSAPILFIAGNESPDFSSAEKATLKLFVERGGMILGNADCGSANFVSGFEKLAAELFPNYPLRELPKSHPILAGEQFSARKWKVTAPLRGVSNGVRELMLLPRSDLSQSFQRQSDVEARVQYQLASNIVLYAMDKTGLRTKGDSYLIEDDPGIAPQRQIRVSRLQYAGNWDPEPGGWQRLKAVLQNDSKIGMTVDAVTPGEGKLKGHQLAHLTGTAAFKLTDPQRQEIKQFVVAGGTLCIDAAGGSTEFAAKAEEELTAMFGPDASQGLATPLPPQDPLFNVAGATITSIAYRNFARENRAGNLKSPRICGIKVGNRVGVFYSREDLSGGLVGEPVDGIVGYDPATATAIMRNIALYAIGPEH